MKLTHRQLVSRLKRLASLIEQAAAEAPDGSGPSIHACALELQRLATVAESNAGPEPLTEAQGRVLAHLRTYIKTYGKAPTRVEIADALGFESHTAAQHHIDKLEEKGYLTRYGSGPREIRLNKRATL